MTDASIAACREAIALLLREKAGLLDAVLSLKAKQRAYCRKCVADEEDALRQNEQILAVTRDDSYAVRKLQERVEERRAAITKYQRRLARTDKQEEALRAAVRQHHREIERLEREIMTPIAVAPMADAIDVDSLIAELMAMNVSAASPPEGADDK